MARDYAKKTGKGSRKGAARRPAGSAQHTPWWRWYGAGVISGVLLSLFLYLGTLPPDGRRIDSGSADDASTAEGAPATPKPRFDFYTVLPQQSIDVEVDPEDIARARQRDDATYYLLQAGSFRQREDADRRRAELLLLGLEPRVEETRGDNGRWYRVYVGPFESRSKLARARSLASAQNIDTLLLKRSRQQ